MTGFVLAPFLQLEAEDDPKLKLLAKRREVATSTEHDRLVGDQTWNQKVAKHMNSCPRDRRQRLLVGRIQLRTVDR